MLVPAQSFREPLDLNVVFVESSVCHTLEARTLAMSLVTDDFEDPVSYAVGAEKIQKPCVEGSFIIGDASPIFDMTSPNVGESVKPTRLLTIDSIGNDVTGSHLAEPLKPLLEGNR